MQNWKDNRLWIKTSEGVQTTITKTHTFVSGFIVVSGRTAWTGWLKRTNAECKFSSPGMMLSASLLGVSARFPTAFIVSGCSTPIIVFFASRTWISSLSASAYFPGLDISLINIPWHGLLWGFYCVNRRETRKSDELRCTDPLRSRSLSQSSRSRTDIESTSTVDSIFVCPR